MRLWKVALLAFAAMCLQDVLGTVMVVFEANYNGVMAGVFDVAGWIAGLVCSALAIESIIKNGWRNTRSLVLIGAVSIANFFGTVLGVALALALTHHH